MLLIVQEQMHVCLYKCNISSTLTPKAPQTLLVYHCLNSAHKDLLFICTVLQDQPSESDKCTALQCILLFCTVLYRAVLHFALLFYTVLYALCCTALHCTILYCTALFCTALHYTALYCQAVNRHRRRGGARTAEHIRDGR